MTGQDFNTDSFWGVTTRVINRDKYEVKNENGELGLYQCANLIHREQHIFAFGYVSDEKIHGSFAVHHYTDTELNFLERYMLFHHPDDIPQGKIF